ncbi:MAG: peptidase domain-containing ABC transporter [Bacteroidales bacterium]|nr:peptidase domain-containing ABC transporter [Bacteroidales bacterium]MCF8387266.1 peptidase domain-containing ABC transporter [Bacteroidales bacterium]MCF8399537.1 peptidase domain-containing ABC transporter [Bacteroidales bacterium]
MKPVLSLQKDRKDCGPACLQYIARRYGKYISLKTLRAKCEVSREGASLLGISRAAEEYGFGSRGVRISLVRLKEHAKLPCIAFWEQKHFIVVEKIKNKKVHVFDPAVGKLQYTLQEFLRGWAFIENGKQGICLLLEPGPAFQAKDEEQEESFSLSYTFKYFKRHKSFIYQLFAGIFAAILIQLFIPFLTQSIVDRGINYQNPRFIHLALGAMLILGLAQLSNEFIRNRILLHMNSSVNISILSEFLRKLLKLPLQFFDTRQIGDLLQRVEDQNRVERFLTSTVITAIYLVLNVLVFGLVLFLYNRTIFLVYAMGMLLSSLWILYFSKKRIQIDHKRFKQRSEKHNSLVEIFHGIHDIHLNNAQQQKRWEWEEVQARIFRTGISSLSIDQLQRSGALMISQLTRLLIIFFAAMAVMRAEMSLGVMLAILFILGQLSSPMNQLSGIYRSWQEARLSLQRLGEVLKEPQKNSNTSGLRFMPDDKSISFEDVCFHYPGMEDKGLIRNVSFHIPENKVTAIVGSSGCGKTTLLKLMLGLCKTQSGKISIGNIALNSIDERTWRSHCGSVLQDGFLFSDTIMNNILMHDMQADHAKMIRAAETACIKEYIESLPLHYQSMTGQNGRGLSSGQKQRILIARALYKDPDFLFLDEATNALDAENEKSIMEKLHAISSHKTLVVIAHRLSTIRHADQILVMNDGRIAEQGQHEELMLRQGVYFNLIRKQTENIYAYSS